MKKPTNHTRPVLASSLMFATMAAIMLSASMPGVAGADDSPASTRAAAAIQPVAISTPAIGLNQDLVSLAEKLVPAFVLFPSGSGVCISPDGYVLTNHHVAPEATRQFTPDTEEPVTIPVSMASSGKSMVARPVGADPRGDIVLMKLDLEPGESLPHVSIGDSDDVSVGDLAIAIGNPFLLAGFAFEPSISMGVVSATNRLQAGYTGCIQIDAALNPGNSGGPLFNARGELIGINGRILTSHNQRYNTGAGFAIPANQIKRFVEVWKGRKSDVVLVRHGLVSGLALRHDGRLLGAEVANVRAESSASEAGLKAGDVIVKVGAKRVRGVGGFYNLIGEYPQDSVVSLTVQRGQTPAEYVLQATLDAPVTLNQAEQWPKCDDAEENRFIFEDLPESLIQGAVNRLMPNPFGVRAATAALGVSPGHSDGPISRRGISVVSFINQANGERPEAASVLDLGDVITHIGGVRVRYRANLQDVMLGYKSGSKVPVTVIRNGETLELEVPAGRSARAPGGNRRRR
jgi:S1-C subfamily serine protease